jgi:hypothetical protein
MSDSKTFAEEHFDSIRFVSVGHGTEVISLHSHDYTDRKSANRHEHLLSPADALELSADLNRRAHEIINGRTPA